jgi:TolB-like protein
MLISRIRRKIEPDPKHPSLILTVPGAGYKFAAKVQRRARTPAVTTERGGRPSLVVLPFSDAGGDRNQEYFADGMADDITTLLSRVRWLFVIARDTGFAFKGQPLGAEQVARQLGVHYCLQGSVRRTGARVRIAVQLVEADSSRQIWGDRFDGDLPEIFVLQDRVAEAVTKAIVPSIRWAEFQRVRRKPIIDAYDLYLRALSKYYEMTEQDFDEALILLRKARELDPHFAAAAALIADLLRVRWHQGWARSPDELIEAERLARAAVEDDPNDAEVLATAARVIGHPARSLDEALELAARAFALNPYSADVLRECGTVHMHAGRWAETISYMKASFEADPLYPLAYMTLTGMSFAYFGLGDYAQAASTARRATQQRPTFSASWRALAGSLAASGDLVAARAAAAQLLQHEPAFTVSQYAERLGAPPRLDGLFRALRLAGLPE